MWSRSAASLLATLLFASALVAPALVAQGRILTVPGDYSRAELAIDAARDGDTVLIQHRVDRSASWRIVGKAITLIGQITSITGSGYDTVEIRDVPAGKDLVIEGFDFSPRRINIANCAGRVTLEGVYGIRQSNAALDDVQVEIRDCAQVMVTRGRFTGGPAIRVFRSALALNETPLQGYHAQSSAYRQAAPAIEAQSSRVCVTQSPLLGGAEEFLSPFFPPAPGVMSDRTDWVITGTPGTRIQAGNAATKPVSGIVGTGSMRVDPGIQVVARNGAPLFDPRLALERRPVAALQSVLLGSRLSVRLRAPRDDWFAVFAGNPGDALPVPGLGFLWINPLALGTITAGRVPASGTSVQSMTVSVPRALIGRRLVFQAVVARGTTAELTNPSAITAH